MVAASKERVVEVERFGALRLPLGGKYGYIGVRGKQGPDRDKYQGYTKDKKHTTKLFDEPQEAAVALATLKQNITLGFTDTDGKKPRAKRNSMAACGELPLCPAPATFSSCFVLTCAACCVCRS